MIVSDIVMWKEYIVVFFDHPFFTSMFVIGGTLVLIGMFLCVAPKSMTKKWGERWLDIIISGVLLALPVTSIIMDLYRGDDFHAPEWYILGVNVMSFFLALVGMIMGLLMLFKLVRQRKSHRKIYVEWKKTGTK